MATKHPDSDKLRRLADWLDEHTGMPASVSRVVFNLDSETAANFRIFGVLTGLEANLEDSHFASYKGYVAGCRIYLSAFKPSIGTKRTVVREVEEFVIGDAA